MPGKLFDIIMYIPEKYRNLIGGEFLVAEMNIINLKYEKLIDINIDYWIEDLNKNIILKNTETKSIGQRLEYIAKLQLPSEIKEGEYLLCVKIRGDDIALACNSFKVKSTLFIEEAKEIAKLEGYIIINLS